MRVPGGFVACSLQGTFLNGIFAYFTSCSLALIILIVNPFLHLLIIYQIRQQKTFPQLAAVRSTEMQAFTDGLTCASSLSFHMSGTPMI